MYTFHVDRNFFYEKRKNELTNISTPEKVAIFFEKYLKTIPLHINPNDLFAGWYGYEKNDSFSQSIETFIQQQHELRIKAQENNEPEPQNLSPEYILSSQYITNVWAYNTGHNTLDYKTLLNRGIHSFISEVEEALNLADYSPEQTDYLKGMLLSLKAIEHLSLRYSALASSLAQEATTKEDRTRLNRIADACKQVPMKPPSNFFEAIQSAYLLWSLHAISDLTWCSISFGSFDQFMYPYYLESIKEGMTENEVIDLLVQLFCYVDYYGGQDCVISVGGVDSDGHDLTNHLSELIIEAEKISQRRGPILAARINKNTRSEFLMSLIDSSLFDIGQPTFYSEEECLKSVMSRGISKEIAETYAINSCMGMVIPGSEVPDMWGCILNMHLPLELALNAGKPLNGELPIHLKTLPLPEIKSMEELLEQYKLYLEEIFIFAKSKYLKDTQHICKNRPNPFVSAITQNCIALGVDCWDGGALYHNVTVETIVFANTGDALTAIEQLIFKQKKYTLTQLIEAAKHNYEGYEAIHADLLKCSKYGMNNDEADKNTKFVLNTICDICDNNREGNIRFLPSLHTLDSNVHFGSMYYATLDGRCKGEPICKNAGPANSTRISGPTNVAMSATKIDQYRLSGGQALDLHFPSRTFNTPQKKSKLAAFIKTYLSQGGLQLQINGVNATTLQKAYEHPELYQNVIVRIGGHSRYFNELSNDVKLEFINRLSIEERC